MGSNRDSDLAVRSPQGAANVYYPDSDGKPMGETPLHVLNISYTLLILQSYFENDPLVFVAGNMFVYYEQGNRNRHVSPDLFVVRGIPKVTAPMRRRYLLWENKSLDFALEMTSESTRDEDIETKKKIYQDVIKVREYFLFDPHEEYLTPPLQGYRLSAGVYEPIAAADGRLPSAVLGLHLEYSAGILRLYDPATDVWLPTPPEEHQARLQAEAEATRARKAAEDRTAEAEKARKAAEERTAEVEKARKAAEERTAEVEKARKAAADEVERLRRELEELRRRLPEQPKD